MVEKVFKGKPVVFPKTVEEKSKPASSFDEFLLFNGKEIIRADTSIAASTTQTVYTVPAGYTFFLNSSEIGGSASHDGLMEAELRRSDTASGEREFNLFRAFEHSEVGVNGYCSVIHHSPPLIFKENSSIICVTSGGSAFGSAFYSIIGILISNSLLLTRL